VIFGQGFVPLAVDKSKRITFFKGRAENVRRTGWDHQAAGSE